MTKRRKLIRCLITCATLCLSGTLSIAAAASGTAAPASARAALMADGQRIDIAERWLQGDAFERSFSRQSGALLYRSVARPLVNGLEVRVLDGHPAQLGSFRMQDGKLEVFGASGEALWSEPLSEPLCLPELLGEFVRAHWDRLVSDAPPLRCVTPIIKAKKVAPLQWRRLPDRPSGERVVELGPGSFGMRFFVVPTQLTFSADGNRLLAQSGQFEAPPSTEGRARYLRGEARFTAQREIQPWPATRFGGEPSSR